MKSQVITGLVPGHKWLQLVTGSLEHCDGRFNDPPRDAPEYNRDVARIGEVVNLAIPEGICLARAMV